MAGDRDSKLRLEEAARGNRPAAASRSARASALFDAARRDTPNLVRALIGEPRVAEVTTETPGPAASDAPPDAVRLDAPASEPMAKDEGLKALIILQGVRLDSVHDNVNDLRDKIIGHDERATQRQAEFNRKLDEILELLRAHR